MTKAKKKPRTINMTGRPLRSILKGNIYDDANGKYTPVIVELGPCGITVSVDGYGDLTSQDGRGTPILVEMFNNKLRVIVRGDINVEEATHIIDVEGAKETNRHESK